MNLDNNIEDLDEAFMKMDEEIAKTISEDDEQEIEQFGELFNRPNPFDDWEREAYSAIPDLLQLDMLTETGAEGLEQDGADGGVDLGDLGNLEEMGGLNTLDEFNLDMLESPLVST